MVLPIEFSFHGVGSRGDLSHLFGPQEGRITLVRARDMFFQPIPQEMENLNGHRAFPVLEVRLKGQDFSGERLMFGPMLGQIRVPVDLHQAFFVVEVNGRVLHQPVENLRERTFRFARTHGCVKLGSNAEEILVLPIDTADIHFVRGVPFKHALLIGRRMPGL